MKLIRLFAMTALLVSVQLVAAPDAARAELVLSQLVVELAPGDRSRSDVEILNGGSERSFVSIEPREIIAPGTASEASSKTPDPEVLGLLVSPARMILEPGQRKLIRIAAIASPADRERVYRVTVKPVVGALSAEGSGLKLLVGYDLLVLVRPREINPHVTGQRSGDELLLRNDGNVSVELADGQRCQRSTGHCEPLPDGRLYAGAVKKVTARPDEQVRYQLKAGRKTLAVEF